MGLCGWPAAWLKTGDSSAEPLSSGSSPDNADVGEVPPLITPEAACAAAHFVRAACLGSGQLLAARLCCMLPRPAGTLCRLCMLHSLKLAAGSPAAGQATQELTCIQRPPPQPVRPMPTCQEALPLLRVQRGTCPRQQRAEDAAKVLVHLAPGGLQCLPLLLIQLSNDLQGAGRMAVLTLAPCSWWASSPVETCRLGLP